MMAKAAIKRGTRAALWIAAAGLLTFPLAACSGFTGVRTQGYSIPDSALPQIRVGQSKDLVVAVLGSPQTTNTFGEESAFYYVETKVQTTAFGLNTPKSRRVLAIYFDKNDRVKDKALYGLKDGKAFTIETTRTASFGQDRTFIETIIASF